MSSAETFVRSRAAAQSPPGLLARRLLLLFGVYLTVRLAFLVHHFDQFRESSLPDILGAFVNGARFDASAIFYSNLPFILLSLAPAALLRQRWYQRSLFGLFMVMNGALAMIMVGDVGYFPFTGTRATADVFALAGEAAAQADQLLINFAALVGLAVLLVAALVVFYPRQRPDAVGPRRWYHAGPVIVAVLALSVIAARGGLQKKPLKPIHAFAGGQHDVGLLTLNTTFTLLHSLTERMLEPMEFFSDDRDAEALLRTPNGYAAPSGARSESPRQNVMLIILESFSNEHWGDAARELELTPFLDSLARHGTFFTHNFANGQRSMDALPSILLGIPLLMGRSIAVSAYQGNQWQGLGHFLDGAGYHTSMFHGAVKGTMYFDAIASMAGIREFYPLERYPSDRQERDFDGHWGLYDEPFLQFVAEEVGTFRQPFFSTIFTISTHHPYRVPPDFEGRPHDLDKGDATFHRSVRYVDTAVRHFFAAARTQSWYDNTLFIIVGDHTPPARSPRYDTPIGRHMVPMLLYHPARPLPPLDPQRITQHVDIFRTVLDYTGVNPGRVPLFGQSLFAPVEGAAVVQANAMFWLVTQDGVLERDAAGRERLVVYERERTGLGSALADPDRAAKLSARLKANLQHFTSSMIGNTFYRGPVGPIGVRAQP